MPRPRKSLICENDTPYYHCISRCVRRAFLCGFDTYSGVSYEHRRQWVEDRLHLLAEVFAIDVCAYAVMSNHIHLVLRINSDKARRWSTLEVVQRWHRLFRGTMLSQQYANGELEESDQTLPTAELHAVELSAKIWRQRLYDISWFMRALNEPIARQANKEDECTGRFWEGRFTSQALLDEASVARCMAYVDLNPIRAGMATTLETSTHTSIRYRLAFHRRGQVPRHIMPFRDVSRSDTSLVCLPFTFSYYHSILSTGRGVYIDGIYREDRQRRWCNYIKIFQKGVSVVGNVTSLEQYRVKKGLTRVNAISLADIF